LKAKTLKIETKISGTIILLMVVLFGCSPQIRVYTDSTPDKSPSQYLTYDWRVKTNVESEQYPLFSNELNDQRIKNAVNTELTNRGYFRREEKPSILLHYHIVIQDQRYAAIPYDYDYTNFEYWINRHSISSYKEGTLIIDFMDTETNELIWRGWATAVIDEVYSTEKLDGLIKTSVEKIFYRFPKCAAREEDLIPVMREHPDQL
jgi:hypothetical protein